MKKTAISFFLAFVMIFSFMALAACGEVHETYEPEKEPLTYHWYTIKDGVTDLDFLEGYPWLNTAIEGVLSKIERPRPQDDYYAYANYYRAAEVVVPEGSRKYGGPVYSSDVITTERINAIIGDENGEFVKFTQMMKSGAKETIAADIGETLGYDEARVKQFFSTVEMFYDKINACRLDGKGDGKLVINSDYDDNDDLFGGVSAADEDGAIEDYVESLGKIAEKEGVVIENLEGFANSAIGFVKSMLGVIDEDEEEAVVTTVGELGGYFTGLFDLKSALKDMGYDDETVVTFDHEILSMSNVIDDYVKENGYACVREWIALSKMVEYRFYIGVDEYLEFYRETLSGTGYFNDSDINEDTDADAYIESRIMGGYVELLSKEYSERYTSTQLRDRITKLIEDIIAEYKVLLSENDWLGENTKKNAIEKLEAMTYVTFYDDDLMTLDFSSDKTDVIGFEHDYFDSIAGLYDVMEMTYYAMLPVYTLNAAYIPIKNSFIIAHGILTLFDNDELSDEFLYGAIGATIGHEISHGFDSNGSRFDKDGELRDWWDAEDRKVFEAKVNRLIDFYNHNLRPFADMSVNAGLENGEITADLGGVKVVLQLASRIEGFEYETFFDAYSEFFGFVYTVDGAREDIKDNPHPLSYLRVNMTLAQFDEFVETYGVTEDDAMYLPEEYRVKIW